MANDLQDLMDTLIMPAALPVLREACVMPALVSTDFGAEAAEQNAVIRVPLPQDLGEADDMNTDTGSAATALNDAKVDIVLDKWKYKQFSMTDKEMREAMTSGVLPSAADSAVKALANAVDKELVALYKDIPYASGTAGTTPSSSDDIVAVRTVLQRNLVPLQNRRLVLDINAEAKFISLYADAAKTGTTEALLEASLGRKFGFETFADQLMPRHTIGTAAAEETGAVKGAVLAGATSMVADGFTGTNTLKKGDIFTVADVNYDDGTARQFVVTKDAACVAGEVTIEFYPAAPVGGFPNDKGLNFVEPSSGTSYAINLAFHRNAFMFAARTLTGESSEASTISVATDPVTGIPLRLETWRDPAKATRHWRFDILFGTRTLRPELAARMHG